MSSKKESILIAITVLVFMLVTLFVNVVSPVNGRNTASHVNETQYLAFVKQADSILPGLNNKNFKQNIESYCNSERSIDSVQNTFNISEKSLSHNDASALKKILDDSHMCVE